MEQQTFTTGGASFDPVIDKMWAGPTVTKWQGETHSIKAIIDPPKRTRGEVVADKYITFADGALCVKGICVMRPTEFWTGCVRKVVAGLIDAEIARENEACELLASEPSAWTRPLSLLIKARRTNNPT